MVVGIDKSSFNVEVACKRYPHIPFWEMDAADISGIQRLGKQLTAIFLDISGSQPIGPLATLLEKYERAFPSVKLFVVKSYRLKKLVGLSTVFPEEVLGTTRNSSAKYMLRHVGSDAQGAAAGGASPLSAKQPPRSLSRLAAATLPLCWPACAALFAFSAGVMLGSRRRARR
ncbi:hypothetical protein GPECTOR_8g124 [Gonium pectorale]|uniref:Uncharacterized protein n=1 Tax=Gonium pectorale TaxID=33097 RepID=A0A150GSE7_GONPE|nr:hypothetical protein GPECTOR_8g124 [Gonium pectorale]|eukprot:KXZ52731.1 hypothetical protein GPECTOR_8g124 [Gonium pectorale]